MMPRVATAPLQPQARIGPNSVLQLLPLLDEALGRSERERTARAVRAIPAVRLWALNLRGY